MFRRTRPPRCADCGGDYRFPSAERMAALEIQHRSEYATLADLINNKGVGMGVDPDGAKSTVTETVERRDAQGNLVDAQGNVVDEKGSSGSDAKDEN